MYLGIIYVVSPTSMRCYGDNLQVTSLALYVRDVDGDVIGIVTPSYGVIVQLENKIK